MRALTSALALIFVFQFTHFAHSDVYTFNLRSTGLAGAALSSGQTFENGGIQIAVTTTPGGSVYDADPTGGGVTGDSSDSLIDDGETITFTFTYTDARVTNIYLVSADLALQDGDAFSGDVATATGNGFSQTLADGTSNYVGGNDDIWTPNAGTINIANGGTITFSADSPADAAYAIQALSFENGFTGAIPEPGSCAMLGLFSLGAFIRRRR